MNRNCIAFVILSLGVTAINSTLAALHLELRAARTIADPSGFDFIDMENGDVRSMDHCKLPNGGDVTVERDLSTTADRVTIRHLGTERTVSIPDSLYWGTGRVAMDCDSQKARWFYGNTVKGTVTAYSATGSVLWEFRLAPFNRIPNRRLVSAGEAIGKNALTALQVRGSHILVEWIEFDIGQHFTVLTTDGKLVDSFGPSTFVLRTGATSESWELFWGTSPLPNSFIPLELYTLHVTQEAAEADTPTAVIARLKAKSTPARRIAAKVRCSPLMDHVAALLWSPTTKQELDFCPIVPRESAKIWLGSDYDDAVAGQARRFLLSLWQALQEKYAEHPDGPLIALFQERAKTDPDLARLLAAMAPTNPTWDAAFRPKAIAVLESLPETKELIAAANSGQTVK